MKKILVIYEEIPEKTLLFLFDSEDLTEGELMVINEGNGKYVNAEELDEDEDKASDLYYFLMSSRDKIIGESMAPPLKEIKGCDLKIVMCGFVL